MILVYHSSSLGLLEFTGFHSLPWGWNISGLQAKFLLYYLVENRKRVPRGHNPGLWTILFLLKQQHGSRILEQNKGSWEDREEEGRVSAISNTVGWVTSAHLWGLSIVIQMHIPFIAVAPDIQPASRSLPSPKCHTLVPCSTNLKAH